MQQLTPNTLLQGGRYKIISTLGQGGFGITYLAIQSGLERKVAIKEFFMKELCERDKSTSHVTLGTEGSRETVNRFKEKFLKEARNIAKLNHPNIVRIIDVFEENGTAYYVMEYAENGSLADKVKREGYLTEPVATHHILQIAEALDYIHQHKMNHLDVKPANIMINEKDEAVLIDFGLSKQYDAVTGGQTSTTPVGISHGYAPMEQYKEGGVQDFSPETDIYALGATFFKLLTGITPPSATDIMEDGLPLQNLKAKGVRAEAIATINKAMEPRKRDRIKNVRLFTESLSTIGVATSATPQQVEDEATILTPEIQSVEEKRKRKDAEYNPPKEKTKDASIGNDEVLYYDDNESNKNKTIIGVVVLIGIVLGYFMFGNSNRVSNESIIDSTLIEEADSFVGASEHKEPSDNNNAIVEQKTSLSGSTSALNPSNNNESNDKTNAVVAQNNPSSSSGSAAYIVSENKEQNNRIYDVVEQMPSFPGGQTALMQYLSSNVMYPVDAQENGIQGRVTVSFVVERDGSITEVKVVRPVAPSLDKEAVRVISSMPKWKPGKQDGVNVRVMFTIPIAFRLE